MIKTSSYRRIMCGAFILLLLSSPLLSQTAIEHRVYLLGNFTDIADKTAFIQKLDRVFEQTDSPFTLILNGDLVDREIGKNDNFDLIKPIYDVADLVHKYPKGQLLVVPGDRDWNSSERGGEKSLENIEERVKDYFDDKDYDRCHWTTDNGCPGPEIYEIGDYLAIIAMNTQWWNHPYDKPRPSDGLCEGLSEENLKEELEDAVEDYQDRNVLIVGHHPVRSLGNYGGYFSFVDRFSPLPVLGLFRTAYHAHVGNQFDLANERLQVFIEKMKNLLYFHDNLIYASGHEHNQQILRSGNNYLVNSGAPTRAKYATDDDYTVFSEKAAGIIQIDYYNDGQVNANFLHNHTDGLQAEVNHTLFQSSCTNAGDGTSLRNTAYVPCKNDVSVAKSMSRKYPETKTIVAGSEYQAGAWKRIWFGKHYRTTWTKPVEVGYLDLDETHGGLTVYKKGGGRQTTSLKFRSGNGDVYTFRSVNKDPSKALNYKLRNTFATDVIRDQTSAQQPYGAMVVAPLLEEINILHATPKLYLLPDDPKLGPFQEKYGNLFGMLEENPGKKNNAGKHFADADEIEQSVEVFKEFYKDQDTRIDEEEFVRARLFDIFVGDWSKHADNWKWAGYKNKGGMTYRPIPRDRDHVFSKQDGFFNWLADRPFGIRNIENFGYDYTGLRSLTHQATHMDRFLMDEVPKKVFMEQARYIQEKISEEDIEKAVRNMPAEAYAESGAEIERKLKNRLKTLTQATEEYYALLSREVDVTGSKDEEYFEAEYLPDGNLRVRIYNVKGDEKGNKLLFERIFYPNETREVRLWGLNDDDIFEIKGQAESKIKLRAFGGPGDDKFIDSAKEKTLLYDKGDETLYQVSGNAKIINHWNKDTYEYDRERFEYNYFLPLIYLAYSNYTGFGVNVGGSWTLRKFGKDDYHSKHSARLGYTTRGNLSVGYTGRWHQVIRKWDVQLVTYVEEPSLLNRFYGLGNSTVNREDELGREYYETQVNTQHASLAIIRDFWQHSSLNLSGGIERNNSEQIENTFLAENAENLFGAQRQLTIVPIGITLDLDFRDEKGLPYRGTRALLSYQNGSILNNGDSGSNFGVARGAIEYYLSTKQNHPLTLGLRVGGATTHGEVPWYRLPKIGTDHGLRGYVEQRFTGESVAFFNAEVRYQMLERETSFVPIKTGIKVFYDYGRVFLDGEEDGGDWREGYGFGFYLVPLDESLTLSLTFGFSDEESVYPVFSIGKPLR